MVGLLSIAQESGPAPISSMPCRASAAGRSIVVRHLVSPGSMSSTGAAIARLFPVRWLQALVALLGLAMSVPATLAAPVEQTLVPQYRNVVRKYGSEDGFSQTSVNAVLQGSDGYLWIATFGGLVRFDGARFTTLRVPKAKHLPDAEKEEAGPGSERILTLREDNKGRIWIATEDSGLSLYDHGRFLQLSVCGRTCLVRALSRPAAGSIWALTSAGVFRISLDTLHATPIRQRKPGLYTNIAVSDKDEIYISGPGMGLDVVINGEAVPATPPPHVKPSFSIAMAGGYLWAATDAGVFQYSPRTGEWKRRMNEEIVRWLESSDGQLWVQDDQGRLLRAHADGRMRPVAGLPNLFASSLWWDRAGTLWLGSENDGLWSVEVTKAKLLEDAGNPVVYMGAGRSIAGDGQGGVWLGFACGGLRHHRPGDPSGTPREQVVATRQCVTGLLRDQKGVLWIGTVDAGLQRLVNGAIETVPATERLANVQLWQARDGQYWVASDGHTFNLQQSSEGAFSLSAPVRALEGMTIRKMVDARRGGVWLVGDQGVVRMQGHRVMERWTPAEGLSSRFARALYEDKRGVLWIGTYGGGLNRIENGRIQHYDEGNGLFDDTVSCILADRSGQMWLGGNRGISVLPLASQMGVTFETLPFAVSAGPVYFEMNGGTQSACGEDDRGQLWFALVRGFALIDPERFAEVSAQQPNVHIERVISDEDQYDPRKAVVLSHAVRFLQIDYTAINLTSPDRLSFRYRISGTDAQWTEAGQTRSLVLYDVPWGEHLFEVQARNRGGSWSPSMTLKISRPLPWYQHQWLWPLISLLALLALIWRTRDPALSVAHDERLRRMSARKLLDQKESSGRL